MSLAEPCLDLAQPLWLARSKSRTSRIERIDQREVRRPRWVRWVVMTALLCLGSEGFKRSEGSQWSGWSGFVSSVSAPRSRLVRHASVGEAVDDALRSGSFPPPDWLRLSTVAMSEDAAQRVGRAVLAISEGLRLEQKKVERLRRDDSMAAQALALWVPPRSMLLVSSMIGEALGDEPMILVENLDLDGEAEFFLGDLSGPHEELRCVATEMLKKRFVAVVDLDDDGRAAIHTTASGKAMVESLISSTGISASWSAVGGNSEYLSWIAGEVSGD